MVLADIPEDVHGGVADVVRLGALLPLGLVVLASLAARHRRDPRQIGAVVAFGAAGAIHVLLVPAHFVEGVASGSFFAIAAAVELVVAALVLGGRPPTRLPLIAAGVSAFLVGVYAASRLSSLPLTEGREPVDALGLVTNALEIGGAALLLWARRPRTFRVDGGLAVAVVAAASAVLAQPIFGHGPRPVSAAAAIAATAAVAAMLGGGRGAVIRAVADGAVLTLVLRGNGVTALLAAALLAGLLRRAERHHLGRLLAPAPLAALVVLALPGLGFRVELLHVGHADEPSAALALFLLAAGLAVATWRSGHLVAVVLSGVRGPPGAGASVAAAIVAAVVDVGLREVGVAYPKVIGVAVGVAAAGAAELTRRAAPPPARPGRRVRSSPATPAGI